MPELARFLDIKVHLTGRDELLGAIEAGETVRVATLNPEFILEAGENPLFEGALSRMTHCTVDGSGLFWFLKANRRKLKLKQPLELYHGADLAEDLFRRYADGSKSFFLVGGMGNVAADSAVSLQARYPDIKIVGATDGGIIDPRDPVKGDLMRELLQLKPDILLVGFGAPKQEIWIDAARTLPIQVMIGVGGTFGFYTTKRRAPHTMRKLHLEWLFRTVTEPGHVKRAFRAVVVFPYKAVRSLSKRKSN